MKQERFVVDYGDLIITRAVDKHLAGKHDQRTHGKKKSVGAVATTEGSDDVVTRATLDSDYFQHSGYESLPTPTDNLARAQATGAPIRWLMPASMDVELADTYDKAVKHIIKENSDGYFTGVKVPLSMEDEFVKRLKVLGMSQDDAVTTADALSARATAHASTRITQGLTDTQKLTPQVDSRTIKAVVRGKRAFDHIVGIQIYHHNLVQLFKNGRYKTQFETDSSGGYLGTELRAQHETASFSLHPRVNPKKRPVYGHIFPDGWEMERYKNAGQYGDVVLVMKQGVEARTSWTNGDSLGTTVSASSLNNPTYHGALTMNDGKARVGLGTRSEYNEAQIHGGVKVSDIKTIIVPRFGFTEQQWRDTYNVPNDIEIVFTSGVDRGSWLPDGTKIKKDVAYQLPKSAVLVATSGPLKLYIDSSIEYNKLGRRDTGYLVNEEGTVFSVNPYDVYARGYWTPMNA